ncbi:ABC transporter substrate-binding protein [Pelagibacterium xiamenense]|uniref:ABC transporter substrate-binding protein n=1 Tax=Pelagibacterium xiamenense TaxID=2901140 RepID=UPI001E6400BD|nr:ABC transporter substrate-binding protein [Pelagibacterium xiamenense]MCD7058678.1 ABC transporter substrate-binding protein [Pelagibacterium xiamenense]
MKLISALAAGVHAVAALVTPAIAQQTMTVTDDAGREVVVPAHPQRVVSQNDNRLTLPLLELGVPLVGSAGRIDAGGKPYLRAVPDLLGIDFDTADFEFVGTYNELDYEAIAALEPDLIVTMLEDQVEQLSIIAPTLVIDPNQYPVKEGMRRIADVTGTTDAYEALAAAYERKLETVSHFIPEPGDITVSVTFSFPAGEDVYVYNDLGALTVALSDLGLQLPALAREMDARSMPISPEVWPETDGDFVINFYGTTPEDGPEQVRAGLDHYLEGWCGFLHACREGQYLFFPYASYGYSFGALGLNLDLLTTHIAGRDFVPFEEGGA